MTELSRGGGQGDVLTATDDGSDDDNRDDPPTRRDEHQQARQWPRQQSQAELFFQQSLQPLPQCRPYQQPREPRAQDQAASELVCQSDGTCWLLLSNGGWVQVACDGFSEHQGGVCGELDVAAFMKLAMQQDELKRSLEPISDGDSDGQVVV